MPYPLSRSNPVESALTCMRILCLAQSGRDFHKTTWAKVWMKHWAIPARTYSINTCDGKHKLRADTGVNCITHRNWQKPHWQTLLKPPMHHKKSYHKTQHSCSQQKQICTITRLPPDMYNYKQSPPNTIEMILQNNQQTMRPIDNSYNLNSNKTINHIHTRLNTT